MIHQPITRETSQQEGDRLLLEQQAVRRASPLYAQIQQLRRDVSDSEVDAKARAAAENKAAELRERAAALAADAFLTENELEKLCAAELRASARQAPRAAQPAKRTSPSIMSAGRSLTHLSRADERDERTLADLRSSLAKANKQKPTTKSEEAWLLGHLQWLNREVLRVKVRIEKRAGQRKDLQRVFDGEGA